MDEATLAMISEHVVTQSSSLVLDIQTLANASTWPHTSQGQTWFYLLHKKTSAATPTCLVLFVHSDS